MTAFAFGVCAITAVLTIFAGILQSIEDGL
jgi:hypothetical protein